MFLRITLHDECSSMYDLVPVAVHELDQGPKKQDLENGPSFRNVTCIG